MNQAHLTLYRHTHYVHTMLKHATHRQQWVKIIICTHTLYQAITPSKCFNIIIIQQYIYVCTTSQYTHTCIHAYMHIFKHIHRNIHIHTHTHTHTCTHIHTHTHTHIMHDCIIHCISFFFNENEYSTVRLLLLCL